MQEEKKTEQPKYCWCIYECDFPVTRPNDVRYIRNCQGETVTTKEKPGKKCDLCGLPVGILQMVSKSKFKIIESPKPIDESELHEKKEVENND